MNLKIYKWHKKFLQYYNGESGKNTGHKMFLRNHDSYDWTAVDRKRLKELRSLAEGFWMLNDNADRASTCAVCYLYPVTTKANKLMT